MTEPAIELDRVSKRYWKIRERSLLRSLLPFGAPYRSELWALRDIDLRIDREYAQSVLTAWVDILKPGDTILSFNWDLLHEAALWRAGKWHFGDGYGFQCRDAPEGTHSQIKILKFFGIAKRIQVARVDSAIREREAA